MTLSSLPPLTQIAQDAYALAEPVAAGDDQRGYPIAILFGGIGEMFREVEELVRALPGREPWQQALDINTAPTWLYPWLGQWVGVRVNLWDPPAVQQAQIIAEANFQRGGPQALISAIAATLTGSQRVQLVERVSDAWTMEAVTDPTETPDVAATTRAALDAKVVGLLLTLVQASVPIIDEGTRDVDSSTGTIDTAVLSDIT